MPTLGRSRWWSEAADSAASLPGCERVVACPEQIFPAGPGQRVVRDEGGGLYAAVNAGLRAAGDWDVGTYLNDDDRLVASGVTEALRCLESDRRIGAVFGRVHMISGGGGRVAEIPVARNGADLGPLLSAGIVPLAQPGTVFRREMFDGVGGFDATWSAAGDMEFFMRAWRGGWRFEFVDVCVAEFRVHAGQISQRTAVVSAESARLVGLAREIPAWIDAARAAKWRFRWNNAGIYAARLRRHGFVSMDRLYQKGGR